MNAYEKMIKTMRAESDRHYDPFRLKVAEMTSGTTCRYANIDLDADDLLFAEHLIHPQTNKKHIRMRLMGDSGTWQSYEKEDLEDGSDEWTSGSRLKAGDMVLVVQISEDKYAVIERLVNV